MLSYKPSLRGHFTRLLRYLFAMGFIGLAVVELKYQSSWAGNIITFMGLLSVPFSSLSIVVLLCWDMKLTNKEGQPTVGEDMVSSYAEKQKAGLRPRTPGMLFLYICFTAISVAAGHIVTGGFISIYLIVAYVVSLQIKELYKKQFSPEATMRIVAPTKKDKELT